MAKIAVVQEAPAFLDGDARLGTLQHTAREGGRRVIGNATAFRAEPAR